MDVRVDEPGQHGLTLALEHLTTLGRLERPRSADPGHRALPHQQVVVAVDVGTRIEHACSADQQRGGVGSPRGEPHPREARAAHAGCSTVDVGVPAEAPS